MKFDDRGNAYDACGVCGIDTPLSQLEPHKVDAGWGRTTFDARKRTETGARIGSEPDIQTRMFRKQRTVQACRRCRGVNPLPTPRLVKSR